MPRPAKTARNAARGVAAGRWLPAITLAAAFGAIGASALGALHGLSGEAHDLLIDARNGARAAPDSVVLVEVDGPTVAGLRQGLPIPRTAYGTAIRRLDALGARAIAIDVQFTEPSEFEREDEAMLAAMQDTSVPVILATSEVAPDGDTAVFGGRANLEPAGARAAHSGIPRDADGSLRRIVRSVDGLDTLAQATVRALGEPGLPSDEVLLDPTVPGERLERVSLGTLISRRPVDQDRIRRVIAGRVAVIGVTAVGASGDDDDPIAGSSNQIPGVAAQTQAIDTALRGAPLRDGGTLAAFGLALLAGTFAGVGTRRRLRVQLLAVAGTGVAVVAAAVVAVRAGLLVDPVPAIVALVLGGTLAAAVRAAAERERRTAARATLARFVPPAVVDQLLDETRDARLPPQAQIASVLFCDLRGYTALVAGLDRPEALIAVLDTYLTAVTQTVHAHGGTVVSFQGDGVMAAFGVPQASGDSAARAVAAARSLVEEALPRVRDELRDVVPGGAAALALGVGVATGSVFAGTVGPPERREYAVVGPTTNLAARLQALTKTEGVAVLIDDATAEAVAGPDRSRTYVGIDLAAGGGLRTLGPRTIRGLPRPIDVWTTTG